MEFVTAAAPWVGYIVMGALALVVVIGLLLLALKGVLALMRQCQEIRYGLIGYCGAKKMDPVVRRHLSHLVTEEAIRIVNKMHETGELLRPKGEADKED